MQLTDLDIILISLLIGAILILVILMVFNIRREKLKKITENIFGEPKHKKKNNISSNIIIKLLLSFSIIFFKVFSILNKIIHFPKGKEEEKIEYQIALAGRPFDLSVLNFVKLKYSTAFLFFSILSIIALGNIKYDYFIWAILFGIIGYYYPSIFIRSLLDQRKNKISRELPDAMDFTALCLAAGMNFQLAINEYVSRSFTLLAEEFSIFSNNVSVGMQRIDAFQRMLERNESPELRNFLSSVIQSERLGTPLKDVINTQANELRIKRKQAVEKAIGGAPVKMLFPLILFILPAMIIIIVSSVLLPSSKKVTGVTLTTDNYILYQVTPSVKIEINGSDYPLLKCKRVLNDKEISIETYPSNLINSTQEKYLIDFFISNSDQEEAFFLVIDLPEGVISKYNIEITSQNGLKVNRLLMYKYIKLEINNFDGNTIETKEKEISFIGKITSGCRLSMNLNNQNLNLLEYDQLTGEFKTKKGLLKSDINLLQITITDKSGLSVVTKKYVKYVGVDVKVAFRNNLTTTLNDNISLIGTATPGSKVLVKKEVKSNNKLDYEYFTEININEDIDFDISLPLTPGNNKFLIYALKDGLESPLIYKEITRKLIE